MKYLFRYIIACIVLAASSCKVDRFPEDTLSDATFWKSESDLKAAANYLYTFLPTLPIYDDNMSTDGYGSTPNAVSNGSWLVPATDDNYNRAYALIRAACNIIEKAPRTVAAGVDASAVSMYVAEARFFRAWAYFNLVKRYSDVQLVWRALPSDGEELVSPRASREVIYDSIYSDLDFAALHLQQRTILGAAGYGRISKTAVWAFESRAALFEGTWNKYHQTGDATKHLNRAVVAAGKVIDSDQHTLFAGRYFNVFQYVAEGYNNSENIMVRRYGAGFDNPILYTNAHGAIVGGSILPTKYLIDSYLMVDGLPIEKSPLYVAPQRSKELFINRDLRLSETIMKTGDPYSSSGPFVLSTHSTGFCYRKFIINSDMGTGMTFIDLPIIRYAEVLLNYAEALYEKNGTITDEQLDVSINPLRDRGNVAHLSNALVTANGLDMKNEIRRERRVELSMEGFRYWDLLRWKTAEVELPRPILGAHFFQNEYDSLGVTYAPNLDDNGDIIAEMGSERTFIKERDYLWSLPLREIGMNPKLVQNPAWSTQ